MRKMKDSGVEWIGKIPEEWVVSPLKYNFIVYSGATPKTEISDYWDGDITWITPADYKTTDIYIDTGNRFLTRRGLNSCGTTVVPVGSIIFSKRAPVGTVAINNIPLCTNQGCLSCVPIKGTNSKFYYYLMSILTEQYELVSSGTTFKEISSASFSNYKLPNPPIVEQCRITDYLDSRCSKIDGLVSDIESQITTLEQYKRSVITEAVTKGLDPAVPMKDSGVEWIGKIPVHWECVRGKYILEYLQRPVRKDDDVITCFRDGEVTLRSNRREDGFTMSDKEIGYQGIDVGDLIVHGMDGFAGAIGISDSRGKASPVLNVLNTGQSKRYIMYYLRSMAYGDVFTAIATGIRVRSCDLRWNKLAELPYPVPPLSEQENIVEYIDNLLQQTNDIIAIKKQQIKALIDYKKSLIYEYVTGKKEIPA
jgi:type I restriction enzyme S subunit